MRGEKRKIHTVLCVLPLPFRSSRHDLAVDRRSRDYS
jgi:hypothetical protein